MKYIIDKATNRVIYQVPDGGKYFVDENSYVVEAGEIEFVQEPFKYRWNVISKTFDFANEKAMPTVYPMPTIAPSPTTNVKAIITAGIADQESFNAFLYESKLKSRV